MPVEDQDLVEKVHGYCCPEILHLINLDICTLLNECEQVTDDTYNHGHSLNTDSREMCPVVAFKLVTSIDGAAKLAHEEP